MAAPAAEASTAGAGGGTPRRPLTAGAVGEDSAATGSPAFSESDDGSARASSASDCSSVVVDLGPGVTGLRPHSGNPRRDCRICQVSMDWSSRGSGAAIELGCSCKDDLAACHKQCAEAWFKIKGDKTYNHCKNLGLSWDGKFRSQMSRNVAVAVLGKWVSDYQEFVRYVGHWHAMLGVHMKERLWCCALRQAMTPLPQQHLHLITDTFGKTTGF